MDIKKLWPIITDKKNRIYLILLFGSLILMSFSSFLFGSDKGVSKEQSISDAQYESQYVSDLESRIEDILVKTQGVGKVDVMITLENGIEYVYAQEYKSNKSNSSQSGSSVQDQLDEENSVLVINDGSGGENPVIIKRLEPKIKGVLVACSGADNISVQMQVINSVKTLLNISSGRITVVKKSK